MHKYEEHRKWSTLGSWLFIVLLSGGLIGWAMTMKSVIRDVPREWDYGTVPFTPAKSVYSTEVPKEEPDGYMLEPLPEGIPIEEARESQPHEKNSPDHE
jgi:hypothetical protein